MNSPTRDDGNHVVAWALWCDGVFELVLGLVLVTAPLTGLMAAMSLSAPASSALVIAFGAVLIGVGVGLVALSRSLSADRVRTLAIVNLVGAGVFAAWLLALWGDFDPAGLLVVGVIAVGLGVLGVVELIGLRGRAPARRASAA